MARSTNISILLLFVFLSQPVLGEEINLNTWISENTEISALLQTEAGFGTNEGNFQKLEFILEPELEVELPYNLSLTAMGRLKFDAFEKLGFGDPSQPTLSIFTERYIENDRLELELRELYLDGNIGDILFRLGKQQIVWGKADGLKVLDVVNPQSFREFILDDFDDSRIPLWSVNFEIPIKEVVLQLIWIPDRSFHILPEADELFSFTSTKFVPQAPEGVNVNLEAPKRPNQFFKDSEIGLRVSTFWKGWDLTLNYLYHFVDFPVFFQELSTTEQGPLVTINPRYKRTHLIGGSFSNAFGDLTVRGEVGFNFDLFYLTSESDDDGVVKGNELSYVLGLDWFGFTDTLVSFQLFQTWITNLDNEITQDQFDTTITLLIERDFMNETLKLQVLWLQNINDGDGLVRPKVIYEFRDNLEIHTGIDVFYGDKEGLFGEFKENDRIIVGFEYGF